MLSCLDAASYLLDVLKQHCEPALYGSLAPSDALCVKQVLIQNIKNILAAFYRVMKENLGPRHVVNFIEKASRKQIYPQLQNTLDQQLRTLHLQGIVTEWKRTQVFTPEI